MRFRIAIAVEAIALLCLQTAAQDGSFINPPAAGVVHDYSEDGVYPVGTQQTVTWETDYEFTSLVLYQNGNASFQYLPGSQNITAQEFPWTTTLEGLFDLKDGNVFFFAVFNYTTSDFFESHYFNITDNAVSATSSSSSSSSPSPTPTSSASSSSSSSSTSSSSPASSSASTTASGSAQTGLSSPSPTPGGLDSTTKVGLGVGLGIGIPLLIILVAGTVWYLLRRRGQNQNSNNMQHASPLPPPANEVKHDNQLYEAPSDHYYRPPQELPGSGHYGP